MEKNNTAFSTLGPAATAEFVVEDEGAVRFGGNDDVQWAGHQTIGLSQA
jgi:hypothetical protein